MVPRDLADSINSGGGGRVHFLGLIGVLVKLGALLFLVSILGPLIYGNSLLALKQKILLLAVANALSAECKLDR